MTWVKKMSVGKNLNEGAREKCIRGGKLKTHLSGLQSFCLNPVYRSEEHSCFLGNEFQTCRSGGGALEKTKNHNIYPCICL